MRVYANELRLRLLRAECNRRPTNMCQALTSLACQQREQMISASPWGGLPNLGCQGCTSRRHIG
jgi:hypothetical protein